MTRAGYGRRGLSAAMVIAAVAGAIFVVFLVRSGLPVGASGDQVLESYPAFSPDGPSYVSVTDFFRGEDVTPAGWRLSRPIVPLLALPISVFAPTELSFLIVNAALFVLLVGVFHGLAEKMLGNEERAFYAAMLLVFAFPVYYRGINVTVDLASWLVFVGVARALLFLKDRASLTLSWGCRLAALCGLATLVSELVFASFMLVVVFYALTHWRERGPVRMAGHGLAMAASAGTVVFLLQLLIYWLFDYGFFDLLDRQLTWFSENPLNLGVAGFVRVLVGAFLGTLVLVPLGLFDVRKSLHDPDLVIAMSIAGLVTLAAVYTNSIRFVFVLFPVILPVAVLGAVRVASMAAATVRLGSRAERAVRVALIAGVCAANLGTYVGFLRYGSTTEMARALLPFLL